MGDEQRQPLLEVYYEGCPGCKVDQLKEIQNGLSVKQILSIWMIGLCAGLPIAVLFPFLYFMIRDLNIAEREEDIGFYSGFLGALFMIGRALTSVLWGIVADRYVCEAFLPEYQTLGLASISTAWGIGLIIGPSLGGFLAQETLHFHKESDSEAAPPGPDVNEEVKASQGKKNCFCSKPVQELALDVIDIGLLCFLMS